MENDRLSLSRISQKTGEVPDTAYGLLGKPFCGCSKGHRLDNDFHGSAAAGFLNNGLMFESQIQGR